MAFIAFDTCHYLPHERTDAVRETCAALANMAPDIAGDSTPDMSMHVRLLPGVAIASVECSALRVQRSPQQLADGNDDVLLFLNPDATVASKARDSGWVLHQQGEMACTSGPGYLGLNERAGRIDFHGGNAQLLLIAFPRASLLPQVADIDRALHQSLPDTLPLRLLAQQAQMLTRSSAAHGDTAISDAERLRLSDQLLDLAALALGATPQAQARASARGLRQARLKAIQADLRVHAGRSDVTLQWLAARHGISPRYVRALFEQEAIAFSDYLLELRLQRAFDLLTSPRHRHSTISAIAYDTGFNNLSWFYRAFKQRFAIAPGEARQLHTHSMPI